MLIIGLSLLVVGVAGGSLMAYLAATSTTTVTLTSSTASLGIAPFTMFVTGALTIALIWLSVRLISGGVRRERRRFEKYRTARRQTRHLRATARSITPTVAGRGVHATGATTPTIGPAEKKAVAGVTGAAPGITRP